MTPMRLHPPTAPPHGPAAHGSFRGRRAHGDISDNQVFLTLRDKTANFSIKYPESWAQEGAAGDVTFRRRRLSSPASSTTSTTDPHP